MPRANGKLTLEERNAVLVRDNYHCVNCGKGGRTSDWILEVDHINGNGKDHRPENMQTLCVSCHNDKHFWRWALAKHRVFKFSHRRKQCKI
jgi:5-methylcytosine-specific restriction endonuclease McrA